MLAARRELLGERDAYTLAAVNNLAITLWAEGEFARARQHLEKVLDDWRDVSGERDANILSSAVNLATLLREIGETDQAARIREEFGLR